MIVPSLKRHILIGSIGFSFASLCVFATVAFAERWMYTHLGVTGAYLTWTILFIGLGGAAFLPLARNYASVGRLYTVFGVGFFLYAVGWTAGYFVLGGIGGEWAGSLAGSTLLGVVFAVGFRVFRLALNICLVLFAANSTGYFLGSALDASLERPLGMLLWGVAYGLFLGAGLGIAFYLTRQQKEVPRH
jgi:hypothetical protein